MRSTVARYVGLIALGMAHWQAAHAAVSPAVMKAARKLEGTIFVIPMNQYTEGNLGSCGFEFKALAFDYVYRGGDPIVVSGSFALRKTDAKRIYLAYKFGTFKYETDKMVPEAPNFAWIKLGSVMVKPEQTVEAETPGYRLYISQLKEDTAQGFLAVTEQRGVSVGFNRRAGGMDVVVPIDLSVRDLKDEGGKFVRKRDDKLGPGFAECLKDLLSDMK